MEERLKGRDESTTKKRDTRQGVPLSRDETVEGRNDVDGRKNKGSTEAKELLLERCQGQGREVGDSVGKGKEGPRTTDGETEKVLRERAAVGLERDRGRIMGNFGYELADMPGEPRLRK